VQCGDNIYCISSIKYFEQHNATWPIQFEWQTVNRWSQIDYTLAKIADETIEIELGYREDDDDYNYSRYQVKNGVIVDKWYLFAYGPGAGPESFYNRFFRQLLAVWRLAGAVTQMSMFDRSTWDS
jgi:hypothetical protein